MIMKALLRLALGALVCAQVWAIEEGFDYSVLTDPQPTETGDKIEVVELFMYTCPHCYHLEPAVEQWLAKKPDYVEFVQMPAVFGPNRVPHAKAFYAAEQMGVEQKFHLPLFRALHEEGKRITRENALVSFAEAQGIDGTEFRDIYNSFFVNMRVRRAQEMIVRYGVDSVPMVIVNGKYRTSPAQAGSRDRMFQVIDYLIEAERSKTTGTEQEPVTSTAPEDA